MTLRNGATNNGFVNIVDDDQAMRESLRFLLRSADLETATYSSGEAFLDGYNGRRPACAILDIRMPGLGGLDLHDRMVQQNIHIPVIFLTAYADVPMAVRGMRSGAFDFVEKPFDDNHLLDRIDQAIDHDREQRVDQRYLDKAQRGLEQLTSREREVFELVVAGFLNKQIAEALEISMKTVENHRAQVMRKMDAETLPDLVRLAMALGID